VLGGPVLSAVEPVPAVNAVTLRAVAMSKVLVLLKYTFRLPPNKITNKIEKTFFFIIQNLIY
jgi:hypothetical protein